MKNTFINNHICTRDKTIHSNDDTLHPEPLTPQTLDTKSMNFSLI